MSIEKLESLYDDLHSILYYAPKEEDRTEAMNEVCKRAEGLIFSIKRMMWEAEQDEEMERYGFLR